MEQLNPNQEQEVNLFEQLSGRVRELMNRFPSLPTVGELAGYLKKESRIATLLQRLGIKASFERQQAYLLALVLSMSLNTAAQAKMPGRPEPTSPDIELFDEGMSSPTGKLRSPEGPSDDLETLSEPPEWPTPSELNKLINNLGTLADSANIIWDLPKYLEPLGRDGLEYNPGGFEYSQTSMPDSVRASHEADIKKQVSDLGLGKLIGLLRGNAVLTLSSGASPENRTINNPNLNIGLATSRVSTHERLWDAGLTSAVRELVVPITDDVDVFEYEEEPDNVDANLAVMQNVQAFLSGLPDDHPLANLKITLPEGDERLTYADAKANMQTILWVNEFIRAAQHARSQLNAAGEAPTAADVITTAAFTPPAGFTSLDDASKLPGIQGFFYPPEEWKDTPGLYGKYIIRKGLGVYLDSAYNGSFVNMLDSLGVRFNAQNEVISTDEEIGNIYLSLEALQAAAGGKGIGADSLRASNAEGNISLIQLVRPILDDLRQNQAVLYAEEADPAETGIPGLPDLPKFPTTPDWPVTLQPPRMPGLLFVDMSPSAQTTFTGFANLPGFADETIRVVPCESGALVTYSPRNPDGRELMTLEIEGDQLTTSDAMRTLVEFRQDAVENATASNLSVADEAFLTRRAEDQGLRQTQHSFESGLVEAVKHGSSESPAVMVMDAEPFLQHMSPTAITAFIETVTSNSNAAYLAVQPTGEEYEQMLNTRPRNERTPDLHYVKAEEIAFFLSQPVVHELMLLAEQLGDDAPEFNVGFHYEDGELHLKLLYGRSDSELPIFEALRDQISRRESAEEVPLHFGNDVPLTTERLDILREQVQGISAPRDMSVLSKWGSNLAADAASGE